jgi:hypothetical protein
MYPSGLWDGFWQQTGWGRQAMREFHLAFSSDRISGQGTDVVGPFTISGTLDRSTGGVAFRKQYVGAHAVTYIGRPDGEGSILGTWTIDNGYAKYEGSFLIKPVVKRDEGWDEIREIKPGG